MTVARDDDAADDPADQLRRTIEGVIGVPATEGNRIDVWEPSLGACMAFGVRPLHVWRVG